jgi:predicted nucleic acid-binding protein
LASHRQPCRALQHFPLGGADVSVAVLAERLGTGLIVTLDRRHFGAIRMSDGRPFQLLPD